MKSYKTKEQIFRDGFGLFTNGQIPNDIFNAYMTDEDGEATAALQGWIVNNMRGEIMDWCTGIGIIEAVEHLYETAKENGNVSEYCECDSPFSDYVGFQHYRTCSKCGGTIKSSL